MANKSLEIGTKAPSFKLTTDTGEKVSLDDFKGKTVVLYFYPKDMTSGCTKESCDFAEKFTDFKKSKAVILGVSRDSVESHKKFKEKYSLPFLLLADTETKACEAYGVWKEKSMYGRKYMGIERTTFVIGSDGKIKNIYRKVKVPGHVEQVLEDLKA